MSAKNLDLLVDKLQRQVKETEVFLAAQRAKLAEIERKYRL